MKRLPNEQYGNKAYLDIDGYKWLIEELDSEKFITNVLHNDPNLITVSQKLKEALEALVAKNKS